MIETTCSDTTVQIIEVAEGVEPQVILINDDTPNVIITENEPGPQGARGESGILTIAEADDVDMSNLESGSVLVYSQTTEKWTATRLLEQQAIESGHY
jgi:hypothetical protein